jgi:uncharacterized protein
LLHLFTINQDHLAYDSESFALHLLDETTSSILEAYSDAGGHKPGENALLELQANLGPDAAECICEIDQLIADGALFAPAETVERSRLYPDKPRFKAMCLHISHDCNLRCRYCFAGTGDFGTGKREMLAIDTGRQAVDFLIAASGPRRNLDIDFFGGEPLMNWPVVVELTHYCQQRSSESGKVIRLTITTNATLLDDQKIEFLNRYFDNCVLSLDGRPEIHNKMRPDAGGQGSYERVAQKIRSFVASRGEKAYYLRGTYTRHNLDFAEDVLHLAGLGSQISMEPVIAANGCGYEIRPQDVPLIENEYERLARLMAETDPEKRFNFFHFMIDLDEGPCFYRRLKGCGAGTEYCAVTPNGDIYPCHQFVGLPSFRMGNVKEQPVRIDMTIQEPFTHLLVPEKAACRDCWARYFCGGGCMANAYYASGSVNGLYETGCALQKKRLECALWLAARSSLHKEDPA